MRSWDLSPRQGRSLERSFEQGCNIISVLLTEISDSAHSMSFIERRWRETRIMGPTDDGMSAW